MRNAIPNAMMSRRPPLSDLDRLERDGNDDFKLLAELGPEQFGVEYLEEMRAESRTRIAVFEGRRRLSVIIGAISTGWTLLGVLGGFVQLPWVSLLGYLVAGLGFTMFLGLIIWQKVRFESRGELEYTLQVIEEELQKRAAKKTV